MNIWKFHSAGSLVFGRECVGQLGEIVSQLRAKRVFLVTDATLVRVGVVERVVHPLVTAGHSVEVSALGVPEPPIEVVCNAIDAARAFYPDVVIGVGGGSNMDVAKLVAAVLTHGGDPLDYTGEFRVPGPTVPLICVPTTAGTGSEVSPAAVFTDTTRQMKVSCLSHYLHPAVAVVDPLLTVGCPKPVTADSGIDALTHAIEAYTAADNVEFQRRPGGTSIYQGKNPIADAMASECITLVGKYLRRAVADGNDLDARDGMALAATLGGLAFSNAGVALVHAMEYPVGGAVHVSHGAGNGLLLPHVMRFNLQQRSREIAMIGGMLGVASFSGGVERNAEATIREIEQLRIDIGIPTTLRQLGVTEAMLPEFAQKAFAISRLMRVNPRMPTSPSEILDVYRAAF